MACFVVPMAEAIVVTVVKKVVAKKEKKVTVDETFHAELTLKSQNGLSWSRKLSWLNRLLWGGVLLLAIEHIWHGEVVLWPPFLTAMNNPADVGPMLHEIATIGTAMAIFVTIIWGIMVLIIDRKARTFSSKAKTELKPEI